MQAKEANTVSDFTSNTGQFQKFCFCQCLRGGTAETLTGIADLTQKKLGVCIFIIMAKYVLLPDKSDTTLPG